MPPWIRKILLRGLRVNADERYPSMDELLDALGEEPGGRAAAWLRRERRDAAGGGGFGFGVQQGLADSGARVRRRPREAGRHLGAGAGAGQPETPRQARLHDAFLKTGKSYAKDVWATTSRALTNYARSWADMYKETCEATAVHKVQSADVLDLRMACLTSASAACARSRTCSSTRTARSSRTPSARRTRSRRWTGAPTCLCCERS